MAKITTSLNVQIEKGPQITIPPINMEVEAYDKIDISVDAGADVEVDVQPGTTGVSFLLIVSSLYTQPGASDDQKLTCTPADKPTISLDGPQVYLGQNSISTLLGEVKKIIFSNNLPAPEGEDNAPTVDISILVGRDATPDA